MKLWSGGLGLFLAVFASLGCTTDREGVVGSSQTGLGTPAPCMVTGGGAIDPAADGHVDEWGGNARPHPVTGDVMGRLSHTTAAGDTLEGDVEFLLCRSNGGGGPGVPPADANLSDWGGTGSWNGAPGHGFRVHAEDRGEPGGDDFYSLTVTAPDGSLVYFAGGTLVGGNFQIHRLHP